MVHMVHDEIVLECPKEHVEDVKTLLSAKMVEAGEVFLKNVPVVAEADSGPNWAEGKG